MFNTVAWLVAAPARKPRARDLRARPAREIMRRNLAWSRKRLNPIPRALCSGPVTIHARNTRVVIQSRVRFALGRGRAQGCGRIPP
jgi:hypothetical protein